MSSVPRQDRARLDEILRPQLERRFRRLPRLIVRAVALSWRAAPRQLGISAALQLAGGVGLGAQLLVGNRVVSDILLAEQGASFEVIGLDLLILALLTGVVSFSAVALSEQRRLLAEMVGRYCAGQVLEVACSAEVVSFENPEFYDRLQRAQINAQVRPVQMANGLLTILGGFFALGGISVALLVLHPLFCLVVLLAYVPSWLIANQGSRILHDFASDQTEGDRRRFYLFGLLARREEAAEIRSFGLAGFLRSKHDHLYDRRISALAEVVGKRVRLALAGQFATSVLTAGIIFALVWMVTSDRIVFSTGVTAAAALVLLSGRLSSLLAGVGSLYEASLFLEDFTDFVDSQHLSIPEAARTLPAPPNFCRLEVDHVSFTYPSRTEPSIRDVCLEIGEGEVVALVGENGSGKTTLAKLLAGLYVPSSGSVRWDGLDVAVCDPGLLRNSVAVIFQDYVRYQMSARDNIAMGRHNDREDLEGIKAAAAQAGAHDLLSGLERGYETRLGPQFLGGTDLSVGQWQRIALARAFFRRSPFLILDEPTAALDPRAERDLFEGIRESFTGRSVLVISHRFASVRAADRIYVMKDGKVVEQGSHEDLMSMKGTYAELFTLQAAQYLTPTNGEAARSDNPDPAVGLA